MSKMQGWKKAKGEMRHGLYLLLALLVLFTVMPATAAQAAEAGTQQQLKIKVGSTAAVVNGQKLTIPKPFEENGSVMVPLGVFKKAFGTTVSLEGDNIVKVLYGPHTGALTIGSTTSWKDGVKIKLSSPPRMVSGVLMVPLRFVAGVIGARISPGISGELVITMVPSKVDELPEEQGIDSDVGKTRVGNSYYQWSLNYPAGLVIGDSGGNESVASFMSAENQYYLEVHVSMLEIPADPEELLEALVRAAEDGGETVLDRRTLPEAEVPYARIVSKDSSGALWEGRQYYAGGRLYEIYLTDDRAANYKDLDKYAVLMDSFEPVFDTGDPGLRDLSTVKNGMREGYNDDYGIALQVPADFSLDDQHLYYESKKGSYLRVKVTSAPAGSTLKSWSKELNDQLQDSYVAEAYELRESKQAKVSGEPALVNEWRLNPGNGWNTAYQILLLKNGYRYFVEYVTAPGEEQDLARFQEILSSIDIDFTRIKENFGRLETDDYAALRSKTVTKSSKTYGYSVDLPRLWTPYQDIFETSGVEYRFTGGRFQINVSAEGSVEYAVDQLQSYYRNSSKDPKGPKVESVEESMVAGVPATLLTVHQNKNGIPSRTRHFVFAHRDWVYTLTVTLNDANATPQQQAVLEHTLQSFRLSESGE